VEEGEEKEGAATAEDSLKKKRILKGMLNDGMLRKQSSVFVL